MTFTPRPSWQRNTPKDQILNPPLKNANGALARYVILRRRTLRYVHGLCDYKNKHITKQERQTDTKYTRRSSGKFMVMTTSLGAGYSTR